MTGFLLCADPLAPRPNRVDPHFARFAGEAAAVGAPVAYIDHDALTAGDARRAVRGVPAGFGDAWYRGWMVTADEYATLAAALGERGCATATAPEAYRAAHELPGWYRVFAELTPRTTVIPAADLDRLDALLPDALSGLGAARAVVKDHVKSRKNEPDAFAIPDTADPAGAAAVVRRFAERQSEWLTGGVVLRAWEDFAVEEGEARVWWVDGEPVLVTAHPDTPRLCPVPDLAAVAGPVRALAARFVTTDVVRHRDGRWRVVEVGDGQVSDLPVDTDAAALVAALHGTGPGGAEGG